MNIFDDFRLAQYLKSMTGAEWDCHSETNGRSLKIVVQCGDFRKDILFDIFERDPENVLKKQIWEVIDLYIREHQPDDPNDWII